MRDALSGPELKLQEQEEDFGYIEEDIAEESRASAKDEELAGKLPWASEDKDYTLDWSKDLGSDTIASSSWSASPTDLVITAPAATKTNTTTTVWTSGGTPWQNYLLVNAIITAGGRELEQRVVISVAAPGN